MGQNTAVMKNLPLNLVKKEEILDPLEVVRKYHTIKINVQVISKKRKMSFS